MRRSEAARLTLQDHNLDGRTILIRPKRSRAGVVTVDHRGAMKAGKHFNIQRQEHKRTRGYQVSFKRAGEPCGSKFFADGKHGGRDGALRAALAYRDRMLKALPPPMYVKRRSVRSRTGVPGVHLQRYRSAWATEEKYVASWVWPPRTRHQVRRTFSVKKYGRRMARALAEEQRREALERIAEFERQRLLGTLARARARRR